MAGATFELQQQSKANLDKQFAKLKTLAPSEVFKMIVTLLFDIKTLAQLKLKNDGHIVTSRLRNSFYIKAEKYAKRNSNSETYNDSNGKSYSRDFNVDLRKNEAAIGTNVEYAPAIEFGYSGHTIKAKNFKQLGNPKVGFFGKEVHHPGFAGDSFLYWAVKNVNVDKRGRETAKEILKQI